MKTFIDWHKKYIEWWKKKLKISNYGIVWISFIKGLIVGLLIYHFLSINEKTIPNVSIVCPT
jgi:hypothetical protein